MNNYIDIYGRYHHKVVTVANPTPSGNGWIFTAYAAKLNLPLNLSQLEKGFKACKQVNEVNGHLYFIRNPNSVTSPISRDEILGMSALGLLQPRHLYDWNFSPYTMPRFSLFKLAKQLLELAPTLVGKTLEYKHRNYFWQNNLDQIYRFAFSVPVTDRAFILEKWGKLSLLNPVHLFYIAAAKLDKLFTKKPNGISWLKYGIGKKEMGQEFPEDHPIRVASGI